MHTCLEGPGGEPLHFLNLHLCAPCAAFVPDQKQDAKSWKTMSGWAEGYFMAAVKQVRQALEARLTIDRLLDADPDACIVALGDTNAGEHTMALRLVMGDTDDAGNPDLARRALVALERSIDSRRRFSVIHAGRPKILEHILASPALMARFQDILIQNETLEDEESGVSPHETLGSFHAPVVASFAIAQDDGERARDDGDAP